MVDVTDDRTSSSARRGRRRWSRRTSALPDVLPTERLTAKGVPRRPWRDELRRIPTARNVVAVAGAVVQTFGVVVAAAVVDTWWAWLAAFVLDGPRPRPAQHPRPRGRPPAAVPEPLRQRPRRPLDPRLPDVAAVLRLPPRPLRPPPRRAGPRRARPRPVPRLPDPAATRGSASCAATSPARAPTRTSRLLVLAARKRAPEGLQILGVQVVLAGVADRRSAPARLRRVDRLVVHAVEVVQPAAGDRRARRHGALRRPPPHDPRDPPVAGSPACAWCRTTPAGTSPTTSTWACRGATCRACTPSWWRPGGSRRTSSTRPTGRSGGPARRVDAGYATRRRQEYGCG